AGLQPADVDWVATVATDLLVVDPDLAVAVWTRLRTAVRDDSLRCAAVDAGLATALLACGDVRRAESLSRRALAATAPHRPGVAAWLRDAEAMLRESIALSAPQARRGDPMAAVWLAAALADLDRLDAAERVLDDAGDACRGGAVGRVEILRARAALCLDVGMIADAI